MTLRNRVVLETSTGGRDFVFDGKGADKSDREEINPSFVVGGGGSMIREAYDFLTGDDIGDLERRKAYYVDAGGGTHQRSITFSAGPDDGQWGDGSSDPFAADDYNQYDATGPVNKQTKKEVFAYWIGQARHDSQGNTTLHIGEWTDGTYSDEAGVFGEPLTVAIEEATVEQEEDSPSTVQVSLEVTVVAALPSVVPDDPRGIVGNILDL